ncbi:uncharacterized protein [Coffea arabica]|uniref:Uncharacterized protein isoform X2 n=1 Tax=Coffea arabica TaxID=13443 RepID=A0ABM4UPP7_COFAR
METFSNATDICQQLLHRYGNSAAPQHRHLCATAAATRSLIQSESLPLSPFSYFAATISTLSDQTELDPDAFAALSSFLSILLPLVPENAISPDKAKEAVEVVVEKINSDVNEVAPGNASARALVKSLGVLLGFCNLEDWDSVQLGFNSLLKFSIDKRPKVRKCAQDCIGAVFKSFKSCSVIKKASKSVNSLLKDHMPVAIKISYLKAADESKKDIMSKPEHQEVLYTLNMLKSIVPYLSVKVCIKILSQLVKLLKPESSALAQHVFEILQIMFETSSSEVIAPEAENIVKSLVSYISSQDKNPMDSVLFAATSLKDLINKIHASEMTDWINHLPSVIGSMAGLLRSEASALQASNILQELINIHIDGKVIVAIQGQVEDDEAIFIERTAVKSICGVFEDLLTAQVGIPNEQLLQVISVLFLKLREVSDVYLKSIVLKLAQMMTNDSGDSDTIHLKKCIGSAVIAMGPEKLLVLLPIALDTKDYSCSNTWLIPILKEYVVGSSLGFFMEYFVTLADSLQQESRKVKKSEIGKDLETYACNCWELLPSFCRFPTDTYQNFGALAKHLIPCIKDPPMLQIVAVALKELVDQNKKVLASDELPGAKSSKMKNPVQELKKDQIYSKKIASKNMRALASWSQILLQALIDIFFDLPPDRLEILKDAIGCLASITDPLTTKKIFISSLERLQLIKDLADSGEEEFHIKASVDNDETNATSREKDTERCILLKLASCFVDKASEELITLLFKFTKHALEVLEGTGQPEAYQTLSRIIEKHPSFCFSHFAELMDLLLNLKSPYNIDSLKSRFACLRTLFIHAVKEDLDDENTKAFLILNEIILALKDSAEEGRKAAYDVLTDISSSLRSTSCTISDGHFHNFITMVMAYLTGSSPHIRSGAVSALSVLVYNDTDLCLSVPDLIPSVLALLQSKAIEIIKAVLGFVKVLVSSLQENDLQKFLPDIVNGILPWSSVSRHHFRSKVTVILEIMVRKCRVAAIQSLAPQKYHDFLRSVLKNRHGKTSSKDAGITETESNPSDISQGRWQKRKYEESTSSTKGGGLTGSRKRARHQRQKGDLPSAKKPFKPASSIKSQESVDREGDANHDRQNAKQSQWQRRDRKGSFMKGQSRGKRKRDFVETKLRNGKTHKPAAKLTNRKRVGKKQSKINK